MRTSVQNVKETYAEDNTRVSETTTHTVLDIHVGTGINQQSYDISMRTIRSEHQHGRFQLGPPR
jgi:hypothetical protein